MPLTAGMFTDMQTIKGNEKRAEVRTTSRIGGK